ncbi:MAG: ADP-forming succinate--CoA ligase subunit beta [bacterium]|nr:ADP-forming succinate--CoA ligase subunit beta [bacterium]MDE0502155.1 ADP-forming succinate--CoA ligase subunit beta [bacterium]
MNIHEHQAKELLASYGVTVPLGAVAFTPAEAGEAAASIMEKTRGHMVIIKAQIHAGGRGKGRFREHPDAGLAGVNVVASGQTSLMGERMAELAEKMLGSTLVTVQTGPAGKVVNRVLLEAAVDIAQELYLAIQLDRRIARPVLLASTEGGVEIEQVAAESPEKLHTEVIDPAVGIRPFQLRRLTGRLGLTGAAASSYVDLVQRLVTAAGELDTELLEINPLVINASGQALALDAKLSFEDNALYRHPEIAELRDESEEEPAETLARRAGLNYVKLDGRIGCMVNGAGLAMATMDTVEHYGGSPANFLDVGGDTDEERVATGFRIITADPNVRGIFVNIFGGIVHCDVIAKGVLAATEQVGLSVPLVVRLEGTNVDLGRRIIAESGLGVISATNMAEGARRIVELCR